LVMTTQTCTRVTLRIKSMFRVLPERKKTEYHQKLDCIRVDIISAFTPRLSMIDVNVAMKDEGSLKGILWNWACNPK